MAGPDLGPCWLGSINRFQDRSGPPKTAQDVQTTPPKCSQELPKTTQNGQHRPPRRPKMTKKIKKGQDMTRRDERREDKDEDKDKTKTRRNKGNDKDRTKARQKLRQDKGFEGEGGDAAQLTVYRRL